MRNKSRQNRAFTLIELLVVILILGILAALIVPKFISHTDDARIARAKADVQTIAGSLDRYRLDTGTYPTDSEGLSPLVTAPSDVSNWKGPYIETLPDDPWGHPYVYHQIDDHTVQVLSYGADGAEGGTGNNADISNLDTGQPANGQ